MKLPQIIRLHDLHHIRQGLDVYITSSISAELEVQISCGILHGATLHNVSSLEYFNEKHISEEVIIPKSLSTSHVPEVTCHNDNTALSCLNIMSSEEEWDKNEAPQPAPDCIANFLARFSIRPLLEPQREQEISEPCSAQSDDKQVTSSVFVPRAPERREGHFRLKAPSTKKVFVRNLDYQCRKRELGVFFEKFGAVRSSEVLFDKRARRSKGCGFVTFYEEASASRAVSAAESDLLLHDRVLRVEFAKSRKFVPDKSVTEDTSPADKENSADVSTLPDADSADGICCGHQINDLNEYTMLHIFSFLPLRSRIQISRVCKRWQYLSHRSWQSIRHLRLYGLCTQFAGLTDRVLKVLLSRTSSQLKSIDLSGTARFLTNTTLSHIGKHCPQVTGLDLSGLQATNQGLEKLAKTCTGLQWIKLHQCLDIGEDGLWWLFKCCQNLVSVNLQDNRRLKGQCFHVMGKNLETLILCGCSKLGDVGIEKISSSSQQLRVLNLTGCCALTDSAMVSLVQGCNKIEEFHMEELIPNVSASGLRHLGQLPHLRKLYLQKNSAVNDQVVRCVSEGCPLLSCIDLACCHQGVTDLGLESLARCSHLSGLIISYLHQVHDTGLGALASLTKLVKLEARGCGGFTNTGVVSVLTQCDSLEELDISGCLQINNTVLTPLIHLQPHRSLTLTYGGTSITPESFKPDLSPGVVLVPHNFSASYLRADRDLVFHDPDLISDEEDDWFGYEDHSPVFGPSGASLDDYLAADDPLQDEDFEFS